jgi:protein SCO1/2
MKIQPSLCFAFLVVPLMVAGCKSGSDAKEKTYDIKGKVVSINLQEKEVTLAHEDIPGVMKAMTMPFAVADVKVLEGLKAGDNVKGTLKVDADGNRAITHLEKY